MYINSYKKFVLILHFMTNSKSPRGSMLVLCDFLNIFLLMKFSFVHSVSLLTHQGRTYFQFL